MLKNMLIVYTTYKSGDLHGFYMGFAWVLHATI